MRVAGSFACFFTWKQYHGFMFTFACSEFFNFFAGFIFLLTSCIKRTCKNDKAKKPLDADYSSKMNLQCVCHCWGKGKKGHLIPRLVQDTNRRRVLFCLPLNMSSEAGKFKSTALKCRLLITYIITLVVIKQKLLAECGTLTLQFLVQVQFRHRS